MNTNRSKQSRSCKYLIKVGLIMSMVAFGTIGQRSYGQWCEAPILLDLPPNYNQIPRLDTSGKVIDAHDGMLVQFGGTFYLYGTAYGDTGGFQTSPPNRYACYTSTDLVNWTLAQSDMLPQRTSYPGLYFRPHVVFNGNQYVLWYNWWPDNDPSGKGTSGYLGVATSTSPTGQFTISTPQVQENGAYVGAGDFNLFVDNDPNNTAYIIYTSVTPGGCFCPFQVYIEELSNTYLGLTGISANKSAPIGPGDSEAPILFKKDSTYYAMMGNLCCFCSQGSSCLVYESSGPLGTWNDAPPGYPNNDINSGFVPAQPTYVAKISTDVAGDRYIWMGDLWSGGANSSDGCGDVTGPPDRRLENQYWSVPLKFDSAGHIQPLSNTAQTLVLVNKAGQPWGDTRQVRAIPTDNSSPILLGYETTTWNAGDTWSMDLSPLTVGKYYNIVLEDIYNRTTTAIPTTNFVIGGWSVSGYVCRPGGGGYAGWFAVWDGHGSVLSLFNDSTLTWSDSAQIVAYLNNAGPPIVMGSRSGSWSSTQPWTVSLAPLTVGCSYTFELQDTSYGNAVIPPRSNLIPMMSNQTFANGYVWNAGSGGYFGWYTYWGW
jgi:hypothetical protein